MHGLARNTGTYSSSLYQLSKYWVVFLLWLFSACGNLRVRIHDQALLSGGIARLLVLVGETAQPMAAPNTWVFIAITRVWFAMCEARTCSSRRDCPASSRLLNLLA